MYNQSSESNSADKFSIRGEESMDKALQMMDRYKIAQADNGVDLFALVKNNNQVNPVAFVAQLSLNDYGISGIDVIKGNPDQLFEVNDVESATASLSNLRASISAAQLTEDHAEIEAGMSAMFMDVMEDVGNVIQLTERRSPRRGM